MITKTPDLEYRSIMKKALKENNGYCPCKLERIPDNKCMCKEFKEQVEGWCTCGLYLKTPSTI